MKTAPCKLCPDRHHLCWNDCAAYQEFHADKQEEYIEKERKEKLAAYYGDRNARITKRQRQLKQKIF